MSLWPFPAQQASCRPAAGVPPGQSRVEHCLSDGVSRKLSVSRDKDPLHVLRCHFLQARRSGGESETRGVSSLLTGGQCCFIFLSLFFNNCFVGHHGPVFVFAHTPAAGPLMWPISLRCESALVCPIVCVALFPQECVCVLIEAISWRRCTPVCVS